LLVGPRQKNNRIYCISELFQALKTLPKVWPFCDVKGPVCREVLPRNSFINKFSSSSVLKRLLEKDYLTLVQAYELAGSSDRSKRQSQHMTQVVGRTKTAPSTTISEDRLVIGTLPSIMCQLLLRELSPLCLAVKMSCANLAAVCIDTKTFSVPRLKKDLFVTLSENEVNNHAYIGQRSQVNLLTRLNFWCCGVFWNSPCSRQCYAELRVGHQTLQRQQKLTYWQGLFQSYLARR